MRTPSKPIGFGPRPEDRNNPMRGVPLVGTLTLSLVLATGCASSVASDPGLEGLAISKVAPGTIIPGTKIAIKGASFVEAEWGSATLHLFGAGDGVDVRWPATFVDFSTCLLYTSDAADE